MKGFVTTKKRVKPLTSALRRAIADSGLSFKALERQTGVKRQSLMKFASGQQSLRLDMADRLVVFFQFKLETPPRRKPKPR